MDGSKDEEPAPRSGLPSGPLADQPAVVRRAIIGLAVVLSIGGLVGTALSPYLLVEQPLALVALSPDGRHLVLAASRVDLFSLLCVAVPRRALAMLSTFGVAGIYGHRFLRYAERRFPRLSRAAAWLSRLVQRAGLPLLLVFPLHSLTALGAATGMRFKPFLWILIPAQIPFVIANYYFGEAIAGLTERLVAFLSAHLWESTLVCSGLVALQQIITRARRRKLETDEASDGGAPSSPPPG